MNKESRKTVKVNLEQYLGSSYACKIKYPANDDVAVEHLKLNSNKPAYRNTKYGVMIALSQQDDNKYSVILTAIRIVKSGSRMSVYYYDEKSNYLEPEFVISFDEFKKQARIVNGIMFLLAVNYTKFAPISGSELPSIIWWANRNKLLNPYTCERVNCLDDYKLYTYDAALEEEVKEDTVSKENEDGPTEDECTNESVSEDPKPLDGIYEDSVEETNMDEELEENDDGSIEDEYDDESVLEDPKPLDDIYEDSIEEADIDEELEEAEIDYDDNPFTIKMDADIKPKILSVKLGFGDPEDIDILCTDMVRRTFESKDIEVKSPAMYISYDSRFGIVTAQYCDIDFTINDKIILHNDKFSLVSNYKAFMRRHKIIYNTFVVIDDTYFKWTDMGIDGEGIPSGNPHVKPLYNLFLKQGDFKIDYFKSPDFCTNMFNHARRSKYYKEVFGESPITMAYDILGGLDIIAEKLYNDNKVGDIYSSVNSGLQNKYNKLNEAVKAAFYISVPDNRTINSLEDVFNIAYVINIFREAVGLCNSIYAIGDKDAVSIVMKKLPLCSIDVINQLLE